MRCLHTLAALALSSASPALAAPKPPSFVGGWPVTKRSEIYRLSEVKVGQRGIGYTVFKGGSPEPFEVEILAIMEGMLGPHRDVILARLGGANIEFTGVISGMSGSPVYIDGRLVGAVSYRFGTFSKEPIAGITPIETMFDVGRDPQRFEPARAAAVGVPVRLSELHAAPGRPSPAPLVPKLTVGDGGLRPIATPITLGGFAPAAAEALTATLEGSGLFAVVGPSSGGSPRGLSPNVASVSGGVPAPPIAAAAPIAVALMRGDLDAAGTGTVTFFEDGEVLGFGHPMFGYGNVIMPMATAAIVNTLATPLGSYKQAAAGLVVGAITQDRLSAIGGRIGDRAPMIPVRVRVAPDRAGAPVIETNVEIVDHELWFPVLAASAIGSAGAGRIAEEVGGALDMVATFTVKERGAKAARTLVLEDSYSTSAPYRPVTFAAQDVSTVGAMLLRNGLAGASVERLEVELRVRPDVELTWLDELAVDRAVVAPGETVELRARIRPYRETPRWLRFPLEVPRDASGELEIIVGGASELDTKEEALRGDRVPDDLDDLLGMIADRRKSRGLHVRLVEKRAGVRASAEVLSSLPASVRLGLEDAAGLRVKPITDALGPTRVVPAPGVVVGMQTVKLTVAR